MPINQAFIAEIQQEAIATRKMLERIIEENLAVLVADMFGWD